MTKINLTLAVCTSLLWAGMALATPTPQQNCDYARITAWRVYQSCVDTVVAKDAKGVYSDANVETAAFAKCRHAYFKNWTAFQSKASLTGSTCKAGVDNRFAEDLVDGVVTDNLTGLVWELKSNLNTGYDFTKPHDADNFYTWSTGSGNEDGAAFTTFLTTGLNTPGFAGANGWRMPTFAELQTILLDFPCTGSFGGANCKCPTTPCVYAALDAANTQGSLYWSATSYVTNAGWAWLVDFGYGIISLSNEEAQYYVRAVRGGL